MTHSERAQRATSAPVFLSAALPAGPARRAVLLAAILASSMGFIDSSVTAIAMPAIRASLQTSLTAAQWINAAYLLTLSSFVLVGGALGDRFGTARVFALGIVLFTLGSLACALALDAPQMIAARAFKGAAAALMVPGSMSIIGRVYPRAERGRALGLWAAASTATTALGPVLGGVILTWGGEHGWRLIFGMNLPLGLAALWLLRGQRRADHGTPGAPVDLPGAGLATLGLGFLAYALSDRGTAALPCALAGAAIFGLFLWHESRARAPLIRLGLFRSLGFSGANLSTFLLYFAVTGVSFYLPMTAISAWGISAFAVTAAFLPISVLIALLSAPVGRLADRIGPAPLMTAGALIVALAQLGLAVTAVEADFWGRVLPMMILSGFGMALVVAPLTVAVMAAATDHEQGAASGINNAVARAASLVAVALLGRVAAESYGAISPLSPGFGLLGAEPAHVLATSRAFARIAYASAACAGLSALVAALTLRRPAPR